MGKIINLDNYRIDKTEFEIKELEDLIKDYKKTGDMEDYLLLKTKYHMDRKFYDKLIETEENIDWAEMLGMGFAFVEVQYKNHDIIQDFMAESMLKEIRDSIDNLEEDLHKEFDSKDKLIDMGVEEYIINSVKKSDGFLSIYLNKHREPLKEYKKSIERIINKWDDYDDELNRRANDPDSIMGMIIEFIDFHDDCDYDPHDMAVYLKYKLGIDIMSIYKRADEELGIPEREEDPFDSEDNYRILFGDVDLKTQKMLSDFNIIIRNYMKGDKMPDSYDYNYYLEKERQKIKKRKPING